MGNELQTQHGQPPALRIADTVATIKSTVQMVQHVMREVMVSEVHYGVVPGTKKPSLLQPGAEIIALAFHWSAKYSVEDLSYTDVVRYRITCDLYNRDNGEFVGSGQGEASSEEEKYRWRKTVCQQEFDETPEDRRRVKWARGKGGSTYQTQQVRQEPADIANTVLKMGSKRAFIAAIRTASGCSDMFAQDMEDLPAEVRESLVGEETAPPPIGAKGWAKLIKAAGHFGYTESDVLCTAATAGHEGPGADMTAELANRLFQSMKAHPKAEEPADEPTDAETVDPETGEIVDGPPAEPAGYATPLLDHE